MILRASKETGKKWRRSNGSAVLYFPHCIRVPHFVDKKGFLTYLLVCLGSGISIWYRGFFTVFG